MEIITTLLSPDLYIEFPHGALGWALWIGLFAINILIIRKSSSYNKPMNDRLWVILILLSIAIPLTSLFIGFRLPAGLTSPPPGVPVDQLGPAILLFSFIPWMLAGGIFGPTAAAGLGFFAGLLFALWETHNPFTPLIFSTLASLFSVAINQRYRTKIFQLIRHPLPAALSLVLVFPFMYLLLTPFSVPIAPSVRLDYTLSTIGIATLIVSIELFIGGLFTEIIASAIPEYWGNAGHLIPSPVEKSLQARLIFIFAPLTLFLVLTLLAGDWYFAGKAARSMLENNMANTAEVASQNIPNFTEMGQILIQEIAGNKDLTDTKNTTAITDILAKSINEKSFFDQLLLFDQDRKLIASYPNDDFTGARMPLDEQYGIEAALEDFPVQTFAIPPAHDKPTAQISFIAPIKSSDQQVRGVLVGRTDLSNNFLSQPIIKSLSNIEDINGVGYLLDQDKKILYHPNKELLMKEFSGSSLDQDGFSSGITSDGLPAFIYYEPVPGYPWSIVIMVPKSEVDHLSLSIAVPLLIVIVIISFVGLFILKFGLSSVTKSLSNLAVGAGLISSGNLEQSIPVEGDDEVGRLGQTFEQMRINLKERLEKLDRMVNVSRGLVSSLQIERNIQAVLEAALATSANSVRIVLPPDVLPKLNSDNDTPIAYGLGSSGDKYSYLDDQILAYARRHDRLVLSSLSHPRLFNLPNTNPHPASLIALALIHENLFLGVLWTAYDQPHTFSNEEVNYLSDLASQASYAAANSKQYLNAEVERQQLYAILASSPDPILVTDSSHHLLMATPSAWNILNIRADYENDATIEDIITQKDLINLMLFPSEEQQTIEVTLPDGKIYIATASPVIANGNPIGRICIMTDVTRLKELNALKSEFVSTVSHDMRYPLTLIHGYASMVEMVGPLNDQQASYLSKIVENVDALSRLVNNLLDLRRIEAGIGLHIEMVQVREIVAKVVEILRPQAEQKRIQLSTEIPTETVPLIEADQALLQKAIYNLVENAIKYTPSEGKVEIFVYGKDNRMYFEVRDTGTGISPVDQAQLFVKFYHRPKKEGLFEPSGSGLGLAIVKSIADRHGGQVWVESKLGRGSTFFLAIPLRQTDIE